MTIEDKPAGRPSGAKRFRRALLGSFAVLAVIFASGATRARAEAKLHIVPVTATVTAIVGEAAQRSPDNLANNATFGLIDTDDGLVLVDPGGSRKGAAALDAAIATVSDKPVVLVIDTGGQDHRWLGNAYWIERGARVIASADAVADQRSRASLQFTMLTQLLGPALEGTEAVFAQETFEDRIEVDVGGRHIEIVHPGPAHTPGDSFVWLADEQVVFSGDIVFTGRLLGLLDVSSLQGWIDAFETMAALKPAHVVPGHGPPVDFVRARADTLDYLVNLRDRMRAHIEAGGDMIGSVEVDQSGFAHLDQFDALAKRNAQQAFSELEWE
ncbi:MBL fold metallo-hydrolase [Stappia sp. ES.058]|uniref:MBL fold metallo-hydrolase n=1 Tax=Stappia sp. ES.058 TaxID=1881061 RepID=UPI00087AD150|nr:MBL fold metallo-hydrolase [Stappia sp. ES.058]SDU01622.1 Glyoxylase, beta-lactamase superfamily II [Stappia sp. ES.058]